MNILVINLTRFGDLLQSQAALHDLTSQGHTVAVACLENFSEAAALLDGPAHVFPFPGSALLAVVDAAVQQNDAERWHAALAILGAWRASLWEVFAPDVVCNLTPSLSARMLALFAARGARCTGFALDRHGFSHNSTTWAAFMQSAAAARGVSPFNVVDLFRRIAGAPGGGASVRAQPGDASLRPPEPARLAAMRARLAALAPRGRRGFIALQPGASEDRRRWPVASFARLGDMLWRLAGLCPVLLGSSGEKQLAERYGALADHPYINLCGETGLGDLAAALSCCRMLVTNDTGTMHYAAGLGLPVLALFLATAQPFDTGPYLAGSCALEPDCACHPCAFGSGCTNGFACRDAIAPETVGGLALARLRDGKWSPPAEGQGARIWVCEEDAQGFMDLRSISGHADDARTLWMAVQRHYLRSFLDRTRGSGFVPPPFDQGILVDAPALGSVLEQSARLCGLMLEQGKALARSDLPLLKERFIGTWHRVREGLAACPDTGALALLWTEETQAEGQDLSMVLAVTAEFAVLLEALRQRTKTAAG